MRVALRVTGLAAGSLMVAGMLTLTQPAPPADAAPQTCNDAFCVPGIAPNVGLGAYCANTSYFVFGTTSWGRLVFCGSPRRYEPRYFRSPPMVGIKEENTPCDGYLNDVAQAPDGLFLSCVAMNGASLWRRGDA
ncbi:hypothetical protein BH10ACT9_BH10ACT9_21160 [soil metagenome]